MPTVKLADMEMFYRVDDFTDPWTTPEVVLMHHGGTRHHGFWYAWVPVLARHFRVVRIDFRGHGQSTVPPTDYPWSLRGLVEDVRSFLDALHLERVHFVGEMGGTIVGLGLAAWHPDRVASLSLCSTPLLFKEQPGTKYDVGLGSQVAAIEKLGPRRWFEATQELRFDPRTAGPAMVTWYTAEVSKIPVHVQSGYVKALGGGKELLPHLNRIQAPTLILVPEMDMPGPKDPAPHKQIPQCRLVPVSGHRRAMYVSAAEQCAGIVLDFLRQVTGAPR